MAHLLGETLTGTAFFTPSKVERLAFGSFHDRLNSLKEARLKGVLDTMEKLCFAMGADKSKTEPIICAHFLAIGLPMWHQHVEKSVHRTCLVSQILDGTYGVSDIFLGRLTEPHY